MIEERHIATVVKIDDPEKRGRIKIKCAGILGDEESDLPMWVEPLLNWGWFFVPDIGEIIEVVIDSCGEQDESYGQTSIENPGPKWRGLRYSQKEAGEEGAAPVPDNFTSKNYGKRRGLKTPAGHVLIFDDTAGDEEVTLTCASGIPTDRKQTSVSMNATGSIAVTGASGASISIDGKTGQITLTSELAVNVNAPTINVGEGADSFMVRGTDLFAWLGGHTHTVLALPGPAAQVTTPPVNPPPASALSTIAKVK